MPSNFLIARYYSITSSFKRLPKLYTYIFNKRIFTVFIHQCINIIICALMLSDEIDFSLVRDGNDAILDLIKSIKEHSLLIQFNYFFL